MTEHVLLTVSWLIGLVPSVALLGLILWRVDWNRRDNPGGRAMVALSGVLTATYLLSVLILLVPALLTGPAGLAIRVGARVAIAAVLWNLLRLFVRAQRAARRKESNVDLQEGTGADHRSRAGGDRAGGGVRAAPEHRTDRLDPGRAHGGAGAGDPSVRRGAGERRQGSRQGLMLAWLRALLIGESEIIRRLNRIERIVTVNQDKINAVADQLATAGAGIRADIQELKDQIANGTPPEQLDFTALEARAAALTALDEENPAPPAP